MLTENGKKILEKAEDVILRKFDECLSSQEPITDAAFESLMDGVRVLDRICRMNDQQASQSERSEG